MPSHRIHFYINRLYFGRIYPRIHKTMDKPVKYYGRGHRILFHTDIWAIYIAQKEYPGDLDAEKSALLHLEYDRICSRDPEYREFLENLAKRGVKQRKKLKKHASQLKKIISQNKKRRKSWEKKLKANMDKILKFWKHKKKGERNPVSRLIFEMHMI